jgi:hypothetical protein
MNYRVAYTRLFLAMSVSDAKEILGFPPNYNPTTQEINKARASSLRGASGAFLQTSKMP